MASVRSNWARTTISLSGTFTPGEWADAGVIPMPGGYILVKNDAQFLYLAIDLHNDLGNSPGVEDYFWLSFDVDRDANISPRVDLDYGIYPSMPIRMARSYYLGPGTWTGILGTPSLSAVQQGFGASPYAAAPHRIWEMRIALDEVGMGALGALSLPCLRFGLRVSSSSPSFVTDFPPNFYSNFSQLHEIYLATGPDIPPPPGSGPVIATVGLIPTTQIVQGRATTEAPYKPTVTNAAFGGTLNFIYNRPNLLALWEVGARKYRILHRFIGTSLPTTPTTLGFSALRRTWANYRWTGSTYVLDFFGPDSKDSYELKNPGLDYATKDLLFQWVTVGGGEAPAPTGFHEFRVEFQNAAGQVLPATEQTLQLYVDNVQPELQIYEVKYKNVPVLPCSIVEITETPDPVQVRFRAFDPEGNLRSFVLRAYYGGSGTPPINLLPANMGVYPGNNWQGVADQTINCPINPKFPPVSCAYQIRLSAWPRVTNGYDYIGYGEATTHITFRRPGAPAFVVPQPLVAPLGFQNGPGDLYLVGTKV